MVALDRKGLRDWGYSILDNGYELLRRGKEGDQFLASCFDPPTRTFVDYWFLRATQREAAALMLAIQD